MNTTDITGSMCTWEDEPGAEVSEQAPAGDASEPGDPGDTNTPATESITEPEPTEPDATIDWNGELENLRTTPWYADLPEPVQAALISGLEAKYKAYEQGYQGKYQKLAASQKALEAEKAAAAAQLEEAQELRRQAQALFYADPDQPDPRIADLEERARKLEAEHQSAQEIVKRYEAQQVDALEARLQKEYVDIYDNDEALGAWVDLVKAGRSEEIAAKMVRAAYPPPPEPEPEPQPEEPPKDVLAANEGGAHTGVLPRKAETYAEVMRRHQREAG